MNAHCAALGEEHRAALIRLGLKVLPRYMPLGHHDPTSAEYVKYKEEKSQIPEHAERILRQAVPVDDTPTCMTWWAWCEHRFFHRYMGSLENGVVCVHWNGTTNPNATRNRLDPRHATTEQTVPASVKDRLAKLSRVSDCGCREVDR